MIDLKIDYGGYTPFIPSKFVYLLYTDKPIVVFARKDSWMCRLVTEYPDAGIWFADVNEEGALAAVSTKIMEMPAGATWNRDGIRSMFSKHQVIEAFLSRCNALLK